MNVLVWQNFGHSHVMAAETSSHLNQIALRIESETQNWGLTQEVEADMALVRSYCVTHNLNGARRTLKRFVDRCCKGHESFEVFEFTQLEGA